MHVLPIQNVKMKHKTALAFPLLDVRTLFGSHLFSPSLLWSNECGRGRRGTLSDMFKLEWIIDDTAHQIPIKIR